MSFNNQGNNVVHLLYDHEKYFTLKRITDVSKYTARNTLQLHDKSQITGLCAQSKDNDTLFRGRLSIKNYSNQLKLINSNSDENDLNYNRYNKANEHTNRKVDKEIRKAERLPFETIKISRLK